MVNLKKKSQVLLILISIIVLSISTNFFRNLYEVIEHKFDDRITKKYDYCTGESVGYLLYIKKKYQINDNPDIINYIHTASVDWTMINTKKIDQNSNRIILLNYTGSNHVKNLNKISNNLFQLKDPHFLVDKFSIIKDIEVHSEKSKQKILNWTINIYTVDKYRNSENIKILSSKDNLDINSKINLDMNLKKLNLSEKKLYFEIDSKNIINLDDLQIKIFLKNRYVLENFKIINKNNDCYFLEKI